MMLYKNSFTIAYYEVEGNSWSKVLENINQTAPLDTSGNRVFGYTDWWISWENYRPFYSITIILPKWIDKENAPLEIQQKWDTFVENVYQHELGHANYVQDHYEDSTGFYTVLNNLRIHDIEYDLETEHGYTQGVIYPLIEGEYAQN